SYQAWQARLLRETAHAFRVGSAATYPVSASGQSGHPNGQSRPGLGGATAAVRTGLGWRYRQGTRGPYLDRPSVARSVQRILAAGRWPAQGRTTGAHVARLGPMAWARSGAPISPGLFAI